MSTSGRVSEREQQAAADAVSAALSDIEETVRRCVIRLEHGTDPHHVRRAKARLTVDLDRGAVHAHAEAESVAQAVDAAATRLHEQLRRRADQMHDARRHGASIRDANRNDAHTDPVPVRPVDERETIERVTFGPAVATLDEAIFDLDALAEEFHLFVETDSGDDALVRRADASVSAIVQFGSGLPDDRQAPVAASPCEFDPAPAPWLSVDAARQLLDIGESHYVFFRDTDTERAAVLYRRHDGHDGLVRAT